MTCEARTTQTAWDHIECTKHAYDAALSRFNETTEREHGRFAVDAAIYTMNAAELRLRAAIERDRSLFCPEGLDKEANRKGVLEGC